MLTTSRRIGLATPTFDPSAVYVKPLDLDLARAGGAGVQMAPAPPPPPYRWVWSAMPHCWTPHPQSAVTYYLQEQ